MRSRTFGLLLILLSLAGLLGVGYLAAQEQYTVYVDGRPLSVSGRYETVAQVIAAAQISLQPADRISPDLTTPASPQTAIQVQKARPVTVRTESSAQTYWTHQPNLGAFLREVGLVVQRTDQVTADGQPVSFGRLDNISLPAEVEVGRFLTVTIHDDNRQMTRRTAAQTVGQVLQEAGITLYAADGVEPPLGSWLTPDLHVTVHRSMPITIQLDGRLIHTRSHHTHVLDILAEAGIGLVGQDFARPPLEAAVQPGGAIQVVRVTEDFRLQDEPIPYETLYQASDQLELDSRAVLSYGVPGILRRRLRVRYENGVEVSQTPDGEWVAQPPVNEVIGYGTRINVRVLETPDGAYEYWRVVRMRVTAYTAASSGKAPDHPAYGITASGALAGTGIVAVDPSVIPFRSFVYVPGYGIGYAGDTGGGVRGRWIDLGYSEADFVGWNSYVDVYYLTPVPAAEDINYLIPTWLP
ncbi:MAG: ubiquitin-like domain-containing protein [Chloroflexota bacterium]